MSGATCGTAFNKTPGIAALTRATFVSREKRCYVRLPLSAFSKLTVTVRDGHLYLAGSYSVGSTYHFTLSEPVELLPETRQQYFTLLTGETSFRFEKNEKGIVDRCIIVSGKKEREAKKILP